MKKFTKTRALICIMVVLSGFSSVAQKIEANKSRSILFVGNSLTYYNDMPQMLQKMLGNQKINYKVDQATYSGISLTQHLNRKITKTEKGTELTALKPNDTSSTLKKLYSEKWDFVVLQNGTVGLLIPEARKLVVKPAILGFKEKLKNTTTQFVLFKTWPSLDTFPKQHCYPAAVIDKSIEKNMCCSPLITSIEQEAKLVNEAYDSIAIETNVPTLPITDCYIYVIKNHPTINLYHDESHPSILGSYLCACMFYKYFTKQKASTIKYTGEIDKKSAKAIQDVVDKYYQ